MHKDIELSTQFYPTIDMVKEKELCSFPRVTPTGNKIRGTGSVSKDLNCSPSVQLVKFGHKSVTQTNSGQVPASVEPIINKIPEFCSVCGETASNCESLTLEENEVLEEFIQKPFPLSSLGCGSRFFKKYRICSGCSGKLEKLARWKKEIDEITQSLTTIAKNRQYETGQTSSNVNQKQRSSEHSSLQNGGDEQYKLQSKSVTDGPGMELEMTDFDSDTDEELEMVTSNKGQSAMDGRQISTNVDNDNFDDQKIESKNQNGCVNPDELAPNEENGRSICHQCDKSYSRLHDLLRHQKKFHGKRNKLKKRGGKRRNCWSKPGPRSKKSPQFQDQPQPAINKDVSLNTVQDDEHEVKIKEEMEFDLIEVKGNSENKAVVSTSVFNEDGLFSEVLDGDIPRINNISLDETSLPHRQSRIVAEERLHSMMECESEDARKNKGPVKIIESPPLPLQTCGTKNKCDICLLKFKTMLGYRQHLSSAVHRVGKKTRRNEEHGRGASFGCEECARTFPFVKALYGHMNSAHGTRVSKPIVPDMLPEIIHDPQTLELQDLEAPGSNNKCGVCLLTFKSEVGYGNHLTSTLHRIGENSRRKDEFGVNFRCGDCWRSFPFVRALQKHVIESHGIRAPPRAMKTFRCEPCNQNYVHLRGLREHLQTDKHVLHVGGETALKELQKRKSLECATCHKKYMTSKMLSCHMKNAHVNEKAEDRLSNQDSVAPIKGFPSDSRVTESDAVANLQHSFTNAPTMVQRFKKHKKKVGFILMKNRYRCEPCKRDYSSYHKLKEHRLRDKHVQNVGGEEGLAKLEKLKRFECHTCKKMFMTSGLLQDHVKRVHKTARLRCEPCNKAYKFASNLKEHLLSDSHAEKIGGADAVAKLQLKKPFQCHTCNKKFMTRKMYRDHIRTHKNEKIRCVPCNKGFKLAAELGDHLLSASHSKKVGENN